MSTVFDTTTLDAATDGVTTVNKSFLDGIITDLEKGIFTTAGDTYSVVSWDGDRSAFTWGLNSAVKDLFLQRYSSSGVELKNAGNDEWRDVRIRHIAVASGITPTSVATHGQIFVVDDTMKFMDTGGTVTELGAGTFPDIHLSVAGAEVSSTNPPGVSAQDGRIVLSFDDASDELVYWTFRWPSWYSTHTVDFTMLFSNGTGDTGDASFIVDLWATSPGDVATILGESYDTSNAVTATHSGITNSLSEATATLTNLDSVAAGDLVTVRFWRDGNGGSDTLTGDVDVWAASLEFTL